MITAPETPRRRSGSASVGLVDDLEAVREDWGRLAEVGRNIFWTWEWSELWWRHYGDERPLRIAVSTDDDEIAALVPLFVWSTRPLRMLRLLGHGHGDRLGPICAEGDAAAATRAMRLALAAEPHDVFVGDWVAGDRDWTGSRRPRRSYDRLPHPRPSGRLVARVPCTPESALPQGLHLARNRLERHGAAAFRYAAPATLEADLDAAFRLHEARFGDHVGCLFCGEHKTFQREFAAIALERGWLRLLLWRSTVSPSVATTDSSSRRRTSRTRAAATLPGTASRSVSSSRWRRFAARSRKAARSTDSSVARRSTSTGTRARIPAWRRSSCRVAPRRVASARCRRPGAYRAASASFAAWARQDLAARSGRARAPKTARSLRLGSQSARQANGLRRGRRAVPCSLRRGTQRLRPRLRPRRRTAESGRGRGRSRPRATRAADGGQPGRRVRDQGVGEDDHRRKAQRARQEPQERRDRRVERLAEDEREQHRADERRDERAAAVTSAAERKARSACSVRSPTSVRAAAGRSAVAIAAGRYRSTSDALTATA